jgi:aspartate dehydrogenase
MRIGIIGYGYIGRHVVNEIGKGSAPGLALAFVHARRPEQLAALPQALRADRLDDIERFGAELIVECAHPEITLRHGAQFLRHADYLPLSVNALGDERTEAALRDAAIQSGHRLLIPHGALIGLDNLVEVRGNWAEATITFRKHPNNIDFRDSGIDGASIDGVRVLYDGPVRGITRLFPRNVNTMTTFALATVGLDRCRGVLVADPSLDVAIAEVRAVGLDGSVHESRKVVPVVGVSGTEMLASQLGSIVRASGARLPGLQFV